MEAERKAKEELAAKVQAEWDALDEDTKFYRTKENPNKEPWLAFLKENEKGEQIAAVSTAELHEGSLAVFEEYVNQEHGCWLVFDKLLPPEEEGDKKHKSKPAKKGAPVEADKPARGKAWIKFDDLAKQGGIETEQRVFFQTVVEPPKPEEVKTEEKKESKKEAKKEAKEEPKKEVDEKLFETAKTYVRIKITLNVPVNPVLPKEGVTKPSDLIKKKAPLPKYPVTKDATEMYQLQLKIAIEALAKEYLKSKPVESAVPQNDKDAEKALQKRKEDFIEELNRSGKYFLLKEKLKKAVVRTAREKYRKLESLKGLTKDERDQCYSQLYVHLIDHLHSTIKEMVTTKHQELHEDIVASSEIAKKEKGAVMNKVNGEGYVQRYLRLFHEYARAQDFHTAEEYLQKVLKLQERDVPTWLAYYKFAMKTDNLTKAEDCLREALSIDLENPDLLLLLGGLLIGRKKFAEAAVYIGQVLKADVANPVGNLLMAALFEAQGKPVLTSKHLEIAKRRKMRDLGLVYAPGTLKDSTQIIEGARPLTDEETDGVFYGLVDFLVRGKQCDLAEKYLGYIKDKESVRYLFVISQCRFVRRDYIQTINSLDKLLAKEPRHQKALKCKGHALFLKGEYAACQATYLKAMMTRPQTKSQTLYERLGQAYFARNANAEARVIFFKCCAESATATAWKFLGVSYMRLGKHAEAEEALTQANLMDNENAEIWGYTAALCLLSGKRTIQAQQALAEALKLGLHNAAVFKEIAEAYFSVPDYVKTAECLRKAVELDPHEGDLWAFLGQAYELIEGKRRDAVLSYARALELVGDEKKPEVAEKIKELVRDTPETAEQFRGLMQRLEALAAPPIAEVDEKQETSVPVVDEEPVAPPAPESESKTAAA